MRPNFIKAAARLQSSGWGPALPATIPAGIVIGAIGAIGGLLGMKVGSVLDKEDEQDEQDERQLHCVSGRGTKWGSHAGTHSPFFGTQAVGI